MVPRANFGVRLRAAIAATGYTQKRAAATLGVAITTLEQWLSAPDSSRHCEPHRLMQIGAIRVLIMARAGRRKSPGRPKKT
jgi:hypothetical protein